MSGHSLGGIVLETYIRNQPDISSGIMLFGSYLPDGFVGPDDNVFPVPALTAVGTLDGAVLSYVFRLSCDFKWTWEPANFCRLELHKARPTPRMSAVHKGALNAERGGGVLINIHLAGLHFSHCNAVGWSNLHSLVCFCPTELIRHYSLTPMLCSGFMALCKKSEWRKSFGILRS